MKTKLVAALTAFVVVFAACQKDPDETDNGGTTEDYQPTSAGSTWQYNSSSSGSYTETATTRDSTIDGETYVAFDNSAGGTRYVNKNNGVYKSFSYFKEINKNLKLTYLKDAAAGTAWEEVINYNFNGIDIPITFKYTITSRDADKV